MSGTKVKIDGKDVALKATGATAVFYQEIFKSDLLKIMTDAGIDPSAVQLDTISKLAFILAKQGEGASFDEFQSMSERDYIVWADQWSFSGINEAAADIVAALTGSNKATAELKKTETAKEEHARIQPHYIY